MGIENQPRLKNFNLNLILSCKQLHVLPNLTARMTSPISAHWVNPITCSWKFLPEDGSSLYLKLVVLF